MNYYFHTYLIFLYIVLGFFNFMGLLFFTSWLNIKVKFGNKNRAFNFWPFLFKFMNVESREISEKFCFCFIIQWNWLRSYYLHEICSSLYSWSMPIRMQQQLSIWVKVLTNRLYWRYCSYPFYLLDYKKKRDNIRNYVY